MKNRLFLEFWRKKKREGFFKFCIINSLLFWGIPSGILVSLIKYFIEENPPYFSLAKEKFLKDIIIFSFAGVVFYGPLRWLLNERKFNRLSSRDFRINHLIKN